MLAHAPGDRFDPYPAGSAIDASHMIKQHYHAAPKRHELEPTRAEAIVGGCRSVAARAHRPRATARTDGDLDGLGFATQPRFLIHEARVALIMVQHGDQPHGSRTQESGRSGSKPSRATAGYRYPEGL